MPCWATRRTLLGGLALVAGPGTGPTLAEGGGATDLEQQIAEAERRLVALDRALDTAEARAVSAGTAPPRYASVRVGSDPPCHSPSEIAARHRSGEVNAEQAEQALAEYRRQLREIGAFRERYGLVELDSARERLVAERDELARRLAVSPVANLADIMAKLRRLVTVSDIASAAERRDLVATALVGLERLGGCPA